VSVDTKKKELIGNFKNAGTDYRPKGGPLRVNVHDFEDKRLGKVAPYGVYDVTANEGWVSLGITSDTAEFAVASIRCWLERMGRRRYPDAAALTITADCGGSNGGAASAVAGRRNGTDAPREGPPWRLLLGPRT
jgi:Rhodopirellula transposase DDE domain